MNKVKQKTYLDLGYDVLMRKLPVELKFITSNQNDAFNEIADRSVRSKKLAADALEGLEIPDGSIGNAQIAANAVTATKIFGGSVGNTQLATDAVTAAKIAANEVTNAKLAQIASQILKGRTTGGTGNVEDLTAAQVRAILGVDYGTYTPTLTNVANLDGSTAYQCQYLRIVDTIVVSGKVDLDPTLTATSTQLGISLPVASNIGALEDVGGAAFASGIVGMGAAILGDAANNRAQLQFIASDVSNQPMFFVFSYQVI